MEEFLSSDLLSKVGYQVDKLNVICRPENRFRWEAKQLGGREGSFEYLRNLQNWATFKMREFALRQQMHSTPFDLEYEKQMKVLQKRTPLGSDDFRKCIPLFDSQTEEGSTTDPERIQEILKYLEAATSYHTIEYTSSISWNAENYKWDLIPASYIEASIVGLKGYGIHFRVKGISHFTYTRYGQSFGACTLTSSQMPKPR